MKKGIRYLRFSHDKQSVLSIERQDLVTRQWMERAEVSIFDTFTDDGYSAKTFDRPDMKKLIDFVKKNYRQIDYLVVAELTRFSRDLGGAVNLVKQIQSSYGIHIVSAQRNMIYDVNDSASFFMMSLEFLLGNSENLKRASDINGGIYTAKAKEGRYIHGLPPYGYIKEGRGAASRLRIDPEKASVVRYIYAAYQRNVPLYLIDKEAKRRGFPYSGHGSVQKILSNPIYAAHQRVKPWREHPGGLFKAQHEPIIDFFTWTDIQAKLKGKTRPTISVSDEMPLRGVLRCYCAQPVTGAPSRGKLGKYYYYYKCKHSGHVNISVVKAHDKLNEMLNYISLSDRMIGAIQDDTERKFNETTLENRKLLATKMSELDEVFTLIESVEKKYLSDQIAYETYQKWHSDLRERRSIIKSEIDHLQRDENDLYTVMQNNLTKVTDLRFVYQSMTTSEKQEFIRIVFDSKLYWQDGIYRTPSIIPEFVHNAMIMREKKLLIIDTKTGFSYENPARWSCRDSGRTLFDLLTFLDGIKAA